MASLMKTRAMGAVSMRSQRMVAPAVAPAVRVATPVLGGASIKALQAKTCGPVLAPRAIDRSRGLKVAAQAAAGATPSKEKPFQW